MLNKKKEENGRKKGGRNGKEGIGRRKRGWEKEKMRETIRVDRKRGKKGGREGGRGVVKRQGRGEKRKEGGRGTERKEAL